MLHFPSRTDSLNATQSKSQSDPLLLKIEEELHDARRVCSHGQEEDLRAALNMVIDRVVELTSLLSEAYKAQAELEVQLNVAKSNLQLVISNNEMLEEALKRETKGHSQDLGWRRASGREASISNRRTASVSVSDERPSKSLDYTSVPSSPVVPPPPPTPAPTPAPPASATSQQDSRFFRFRFTGSSSSSSRPTTRPATPSGMPGAHHLASPSMPVLPTLPLREIEELTSLLEKEKAARKTIAEEKATLESELEALSQALFEEANKMVSTERKKRAETEEELKEARLEQEALRSALRLVEGENSNLREEASVTPPHHDSSPGGEQPEIDLISRLEQVRTRIRSSSQIALKSPISSSSSLRQQRPDSGVGLDGSTIPSLPSPAVRDGVLDSSVQTRSTADKGDDTQPDLEPSPWADVPSNKGDYNKPATFTPDYIPQSYPTCT
ncbi:hypothetical protein APHAL10511_007779 [Amanita phalloides]|nr:hypothetical protein APHAL10511_007779 [Amanita phalloides]